MDENLRARLCDFRSKQKPEGEDGAVERVRGKMVIRDIRAVTGVTLHQTACWYGLAKYQLAAAKGDEELARHTRALEINAHMTAMRHGKCVITYDPLAYVWHGHGWNPTDVGLEHEGLYDADGNPLKKPGDVKIDEIIEAGRAGMAFLCETLPHLQWVHAHRQAMRVGKAAKSADPGKKIFQEVGMWACKKYGLSAQPERRIGSGLALPPAWYSEG